MMVKVLLIASVFGIINSQFYAAVLFHNGETLKAIYFLLAAILHVLQMMIVINLKNRGK